MALTHTPALATRRNASHTTATALNSSANWAGQTARL